MAWIDAESSCLIPGLPSQVSLMCLLKVPRVYHSSLAAVCSAWRKLVRSRAFYAERRKKDELCDAWLVVVSTDALAAHALTYIAYDLRSKQLLFKARLPTEVARLGEGGFFGGLESYRVASVNECFAVLGSSSGSRGRPTSFFVICNTVSNEWSKGADMAVWRRRFACGVLGGRLYVAGGVTAGGHVEASTEVYDLSVGRWRHAEGRLPEDLVAGDSLTIEADAVFQGKLYLRCCAGRCRTVFLAYDPGPDAWTEDEALTNSATSQELAPGHLIATESSLYALSFKDELQRWDPARAEWTPGGNVACVQGRRRPNTGAAVPPSAPRPWPCSSPPSSPPRGRRTAAHVRRATSAYNTASGQRAFGYHEDIFMLDSSARTSASPSCCGGPVKCHRLFLGKSWYRAGAIVRT